MEPTTPPRRTHLQHAATAGQALLVIMGIAWAFTSRQAPIVNVTWRPGLSEEARQTDERDLQPTNREPADDGAFHYELLRPDSGGVRALMTHGDVQGTAHINRADTRVADDAGVGADRVWWWAGPFRGRGGDREFRIVFAALLLLTAGCGWPARPAS